MPSRIDIDQYRGSQTGYGGSIASANQAFTPPSLRVESAMLRSCVVFPAAIAALLLAFGPVSWAQETEDHHDSAAPSAAAPGADAASGHGAAGMPGMGMGMGAMMDPAQMQQMHEMMMRMHGAPGGMGMMPGMMPGMAVGMMPGSMPGMGMTPGMGAMQGMGMPGMGMTETVLLAGEDPLAAGLAAVNRRMHREMSQPGSGDADIDFARAMVAHHKGAVDMAKLVLAFGDDPEMRKLAEAVIAAQTEEIRTLESWLSRNQP
jgi:uncharacterized protein (DUF305 family)